MKKITETSKNPRPDWLFGQNPQAIERTGEMISNQVFPMQNGNQVMFAMAIVVRRLDNNQVVVINGLECYVVEEKKEKVTSLVNP